MPKLALGLIEVIGLGSAISAADAAVKSANVQLVGYELTKGDGMVTIKVEGDVGAVNAAISAAKMIALKDNSFYSAVIIPRPADNVDLLVRSNETVGFVNAETVEEIVEDIIEEIVEEMVEEIVEEMVEDIIEEIVEEIVEDAIEETLEQISETTVNVAEDNVCNICFDPACPRRKGQPRTECAKHKK